MAEYKTRSSFQRIHILSFIPALIHTLRSCELTFHCDADSINQEPEYHGA